MGLMICTPPVSPSPIQGKSSILPSKDKDRGGGWKKGDGVPGYGKRMRWMEEGVRGQIRLAGWVVP